MLDGSSDDEDALLRNIFKNLNHYSSEYTLYTQFINQIKC